MPVVSATISLDTRGNCDIADITERIARRLAASGLHNGILTLFVPGATGALTTIEYEPGLLRDLPDLLDRLIPPGRCHHDQTLCA